MTTLEQSDFWGYVTDKLQKAVQFTAIDPDDEGKVIPQDVAQCLEVALRSVCDETMVYPIIEPDGDNGICATWHANTYGLQLTVNDDFSMYVILRRPSEEPKQQPLDLADNTLAQKIRQHLHTLSARVKRANPNWRATLMKTANQKPTQWS